MAADAVVDDPVAAVDQRPEQRVQDLRREGIPAIPAAFGEDLLQRPHDLVPFRVVEFQTRILPNRHEEMQHLFQVDLHPVEKLLLAQNEMDRGVVVVRQGLHDRLRRTHEQRPGSDGAMFQIRGHRQRTFGTKYGPEGVDTGRKPE